MSTVVTNSALAALDARLRGMFLNSKPNIELITNDICKTDSTTRGYEIYNYWAGVGQAATVGEAQLYPTKEIKQGDGRTLSVQKRGFVINVSKEMVDDNQFDPIVDIVGKAMRGSMDETRELAAVNLLNNGFDANLQTSPDGVALFSTAHVLKQGGTQSNTATAAALDLDSLWSGINTVKKTKDDSTLYTVYRPRYLVVPQELERRALELVQSTQVPLSAENQDNVVKKYNLQVRTSPLLTSTTAWFLAAQPSEVLYPALRFLRREALGIYRMFDLKGNTEVGQDTEKDVYAWKCRERYTTGVVHWLGTYGNSGA